MFVDGNDQYQLVETCPEIKKNESSKLLEALNTTNDIGKFVINMRKAFKNISEASNKSLII
jgi:ERCC4-type nuclease